MKKIVVGLLLFCLPFSVHAFSSNAECGILMDLDSQRILYAKDIHKVRSIASISKIMTAILAIESNKMEEVVTIGDEINKAYGSAIYIKQGEKMKLKDLVYGLMLRSGNDAAVSIATFVSKDVDSFVQSMNAKAQEIGMKNTTFHNPSGLDEDEANYSTAYDMAILTSYAMKNKQYQEIVKTKKYSVKTENNTYVWTNKNKMLTNYKYSTGGKTGFTKIARRTLVSTASKDHLNLVAVTLNDGSDFEDHENLFEEAFNEYKRYDILTEGNISIYDDTFYDHYDLYIKNSFSYPLLETEKDTIKLKFELEKKRNIKNEDEVGTVRVLIGDKEVYDDLVYVKEKIKEKDGFFSSIWKWMKQLW